MRPDIDVYVCYDVFRRCRFKRGSGGRNGCKGQGQLKLFARKRGLWVRTRGNVSSFGSCGEREGVGGRGEYALDYGSVCAFGGLDAVSILKKVSYG